MSIPSGGNPPAPPQPQRPRSRWPWLLVAATTLLALVGAGVYLSVRSASYEASADVLVAPLDNEDPNFQGLPLIRESSDGTRPVQTATGLLSGPAVARLAASDLGGGWSTAKVEGEIAVAPRGESNLVAITATTDSAAAAPQLANAYTEAALELRRHALQPYLQREIAIASSQQQGGERLAQLRQAQEGGDPTLSISARAQEPSGSSGPSDKLVLVIALIVGLLVGLAALLVAGVARAPGPSAR